MDIIVGVDESGTGAVSGPFFVCALAFYVKDQDALKAMGARDSKQLTDAQRRALFVSIIDLAIVGKCEAAEVADIKEHGHQTCWRQAVSYSIAHVHNVVGRCDICIDGNADPLVKKALRRFGIKVRFLRKADVTVPAVSAASIVAKTIRNDRMLALHRQYPEYGWDKGSGYLTKIHQDALDRFGKTEHHRDVKPLIHIPLR